MRAPMRILYSAIDQVVPGTKGGSVHVTAVAEGLAALGHEVHALVTPGKEPPPISAVQWIPMRPPLGSSHLRLTRSGAIADLAARVQPDVIMERYHNFGGEAIVAAHATGAIAVLEVNAPVIDHPASRKAWLDRALLVQPMRRWRQRLCSLADVIVTPNVAILPAGIPADRVAVLEWGADTERFRPGLTVPPPFTRPDVRMLAVFAGAFRSWHGAIHLVRAIKTLHARGRTGIGAVLIGDGPELPRVGDEASGVPGILITGAVPHAAMPAALAAADVGVAPFDLGAHAPLSLGFYWSPLKIFEYMAAGLPVIAPASDRIPSLVAHGREGILYDPRDPGALAAALEQMMDSPLRASLGAAARERAVRDYSWSAHCRALEGAILQARARRRTA
jgi:glycosyltransferase involved in cell wall biosynthesis